MRWFIIIWAVGSSNIAVVEQASPNLPLFDTEQSCERTLRGIKNRTDDRIEGVCVERKGPRVWYPSGAPGEEQPQQ